MKRAEVLLSLAAIVGGAAYLLGSPAVALMATAIMAHYSMARMGFRPSLRVERHLPERGTEREPLKSTVKVENLSDIPGIVRIRELSGEVLAKELKVGIGPGERRYLHQTLVPRSRGRVRLNAEVLFEDGLGLFVEGFPVAGVEELTVFPSQRGIREAMAERRQVEALAEVKRALGMGAETLEFRELREFLPGDDITRIDWKATSRIQKPILRVFERESMADVYLLVDVDRVFRRELTGEKRDYLILLLSQLVVYFRRFGHSVRVVAYDTGGVVKVMNAVNDPHTLVRELGISDDRGLPVLRPSTGDPSGFGRLLSRIRGSSASGPVRAALKVPSGSYVIFIDDVGIHPVELMKAARILKRRGSKSVLIYPNPVLFFEGDSLDERTLEVLYRAYRERKELARRVMGWVKVIEVGPGDLLPAVVRRL
ncbi:DUF58 domain-containing protein [Thermococcus sp.]|uniref:DUF58 domain-containing protein n=1 Tax=Thermococcus sp. TaxID=35749 RepID=UPI002627FE92|nr:DUF58 domain-containing protein [Thermococcus sp.]